VDAPLASATISGVTLRTEDSAVWNPGDDVSNYKLVEPQDFVIGLRSFQHGIAESSVRGLVSPAYTVLRSVHPEVEPRFFAHYFRSGGLIASLDNLSQGIRQGRTIPWDGFADLSMPLPPVVEQRRIADFLDHQVTLLDRAASAHLRLRQLLGERIESRLGDYVRPALAGDLCKGMVRMKWLLRKVIRPSDTGGPVVTAFRDGQVIARGARRAEGYTESWTDSTVVQGVLARDVVVHGLDGFAGAVGTSESDGVCSPANHVCVPQDGGDPDCYGRLLRILALSGYLSGFGGSARERAVDFRNWGTFSSIPLPVILVAQQREIGDMIRASRDLKVHVDRLIDLIAEKKQSLITAAVSGEFDVSAASGRGVLV